MVASLPLVKVFKSSAYSLEVRLEGFHERLVLQGRDFSPIRDVVVLSMHTPDEPFDGVSLVVQNEDDRSQLVGDHSRQLLDS